MFLPITAWLTPDILSQESQKVMDLTNQFRRDQGVGTLKQTQPLMQAARQKCQDMLVEQYFAHVSPDGESVSTWLNRVGYDYSVAGENLGIGFTEAEELVQAWKDSTTHRQNLLDPEYNRIGVAMSTGEYQGDSTTLAAQYFAHPAIASSEADTKESEKKKEQKDREDTQDTTSETEEEPSSGTTSQQQDQEEISPAVKEDTTEEEQEKKTGEKDGTEVTTETSSTSTSTPASTSTPPLPSPGLRIVSDQLSDQKKVKAHIVAPEAERLSIYSGQERIKELEMGVFKNITISFPLSPGVHRLYAESVSGERTASSSVMEVIIDTSPPLVDQQNTFATVDTPAGKARRTLDNRER